MKTVSFRLSDHELVILSRLAQQAGETRPQLIRRAIVEFARNARVRPNPHELAKRLGLIGSFADSPELSVNAGARMRLKFLADRARHRPRGRDAM